MSNEIYQRMKPGALEKMQKSSVSIAGAGGLGSNIAIMLARAGIGRLSLYDFDIVEPSNLNRQHYFLHHLGRPKVEALKEQILSINPDITVISHQVKLDESNILSFLGKEKIVCEAFDQADYKALLINTLLSHPNEALIISGSGMAGINNANLIRTHKVFNRLILCGDGETEANAVNGLISSRVLLCAAHQAHAIIQSICQEDLS